MPRYGRREYDEGYDEGYEDARRELERTRRRRSPARKRRSAPKKARKLTAWNQGDERSYRVYCSSDSSRESRDF